ncbi:MAG: hypothetical protein HQL50_16140 [Magnetococcales bacterium]|nr:hypothetical protein [Magnetococcales bacterium]
MGVIALDGLEKGIVSWLQKEQPIEGIPLCNYDRLQAEIHPCDVVLVEGWSRVSEVIKAITQSPWSHGALYIGCLGQISDTSLRKKIRAYYDGDEETPLLVETELGRGTVITPLATYRKYHLRICRPNGISQWDALKVIEYVVNRLGTDYDIRQLLDMARFFFPYTILPRRWRSSLFEHNAGDPTRTVCSSLLARGFMSVKFPILPVVQRDDNGKLLFYRRNSRLFTPKDFDYSPYFEIVKYPLVGNEDMANYRTLPWDPQGLICNSVRDCTPPGAEVAVVPTAWQRLHGASRRLLCRARALVSALPTRGRLLLARHVPSRGGERKGSIHRHNHHAHRE